LQLLLVVQYTWRRQHHRWQLLQQRRINPCYTVCLNDAPHARSQAAPPAWVLPRAVGDSAAGLLLQQMHQKPLELPCLAKHAYIKHQDSTWCCP
jgi:hypothetical protein